MKIRMRSRSDEGAILIIAIIIVTVVALVTGFVLTRGDGSLRATVALRDVARSSYAADAAAQTAINGLRTGHNIGSGEPSNWYYTNVLGTGCFGYDGSGASSVPKDTLPLDNLIPKQSGETQSAMSASVKCTPEDATGAQGSAVLISDSNKPGNAILTLGTSGAENGFNFKTNGSGAAFRVKGGIWSNSDIVRDNNGNLESTESIRARTGCTPQSAMVAPVVDCNAAAAPDPNYDSDLTIAGAGVPGLQTPPANCNSGSIQLEPGYYDDVTKLNALTTSNQNCFIHMKPGTYYLDFHNNSADPLYDGDIASSAANVWTIGSRKTVIGGTLTSDTTVPGRCVNPITDESAQGVQLIFGGDSRMLIEANGQPGEVEFCATYRSSRPPIAIYGQKTGTAVLTDVSGSSALTTQTGSTPVVTPAGSDGTFMGATPTNLQTADGNQATDANLAVWRRTTTTGGTQTRTVTMDGFATGAALPPGTVLKSATLRVTHRNTSTGSGNVNKVTFRPSGGVALATANLPARSNLGTDTIDLSTLTNWDAFQRRVHDVGYTGGSVAFDSVVTAATTTGGPNPVVTPQVAQLDAVRLEMTYYLPSLRGQTAAALPGNTVATVGGQPVMKVLGNETKYYVQGTSYVPLSRIDLELNNINESVFRFGVIARSLKVFETGSFAYPGAVIELPDNSPGFGIQTTLVRLEVYLCPGVTSGCTPSNGKLSLKSRVRIFDVTGVPGPPNRQVSVLNWSHTR